MKSFMKKERGLKLLEKYSMPRTWEAKEELEENVVNFIYLEN